MARLKNFNRKENKSFKKVAVLGVLMVIGVLLVGTSYALYQREDEIQFINANVRWPKASEVNFTNASNSSVTNVEEALNDLYGKLSS